jgi:HSP20 family protein
MAENEARPRSLLMRFDPFAELQGLRALPPFGELFGGPSRWRGLAEDPGPRAGRLLPAIDISEDETRYVVTAELPGSRKEDVTLELHDNVLTLRGEKRNEREEKREHRRYVERSFGSFSRSFTLPANVDTDRISASFADGVLTVELPKIAEARSRTVDIRS